MHARGDEREALTVQEETSSEVVISLAFDQRGVLDVPLVHGPDPVWSAWRARSARGRPLRPPLSRPRETLRVFKEHNRYADSYPAASYTLQSLKLSTQNSQGVKCHSCVSCHTGPLAGLS